MCTDRRPIFSFFVAFWNGPYCQVGLWKVMSKFGGPPKIIKKKLQLHDDMQAHSGDDVKPSESVLTPTLCSMTFSVLRPCPGHTLRCFTPALVRPKGPAMPQKSMRCAAMQSSTCSIFYCRFWNISAIYSPIFKRFLAM